MYTLEQYIALDNVARKCHLSNMQLKAVNGEENNPTWDEVDENSKKTIFKTLIDIAKNPNITAQEAHDTWVKNKIESGWKYGATKDDKLKTHPSIIPFEELSDIDKLKDQYVIDIVKLNIECFEGLI